MRPIQQSILVLSGLVLLSSLQVMGAAKKVSRNVQDISSYLQKANHLQKNTTRSMTAAVGVKNTLEEVKRTLSETQDMVSQSAGALNDMTTKVSAINTYISHMTASSDSIGSTINKLSEQVDGANKLFSTLNAENETFLQKLNKLMEYAENIGRETKEVQNQMNRPAIQKLLKSFIDMEKKKKGK